MSGRAVLACPTIESLGHFRSRLEDVKIRALKHQLERELNLAGRLELEDVNTPNPLELAFNPRRMTFFRCMLILAVGFLRTDRQGPGRYAAAAWGR